MSEYLYRGLRPEEILNKCLIPKGIKSFEGLMLVEATPSGLFAHVGGAATTLSNHQMGYPTKGVSTSKSFAIASCYAGPSKVVAKISRDLIKRHGIKEWDMDLLGPRVIKPTDEEVVLEGVGGNFPKEIIVEFIEV